MALQPAVRVLGRRSPPFVLALWICIASVDLGALSGRYRRRWIHHWYHTVIVWGHSEVGILLHFCSCLYYPWLKCTRCSWGIWQGWILSLFELSFWWLSLVLWKKCSPSETWSSLSGRKWKSLFASDSLWRCGLYSPWNSPGLNTTVSSLSLLQRILPTQGSNPSIQLDSLPAELHGKPTLCLLHFILIVLSTSG